MDAACIKGEWDVILQQNVAGELEGVLVYHIRRYYGMTLILMPPMTAYNGIHILFPSNLKEYSKVSFQNRVTEALIDKLPKHSLYYQQYHTDYTNWLPLYWKGYKETTRYTYILDTRPGKEVLTRGLRDNLRRSIASAEKTCEIVDIDIETFITETKLAFESKGKPVPINVEVLRRLDSAFKDSGQIEIRACRHKETGKLLSGIILAQDKKSSYYLSSFHHATVTGSLAYLLWDSIFMKDRDVFDFEGSIIKGIEFYLRSFGGTLTPHYRIYKVPNPLLSLGLKIFKPHFFA